MKTTLNFFDRMMAAATFAEANESELAKEFAGDCKSAPATPIRGAKMNDGKPRNNQASH